MYCRCISGCRDASGLMCSPYFWASFCSFNIFSEKPLLQILLKQNGHVAKDYIRIGSVHKEQKKSLF
jgi:hypothetical protein